MFIDDHEYGSTMNQVGPYYEDHVTLTPEKGLGMGTFQSIVVAGSGKQSAKNAVFKCLIRIIVLIFCAAFCGSTDRNKVPSSSRKK